MKLLEGFYRGVNLGGWLSQCGDQYNEKHYSEFITEADIKRISSWGLDHVRLPIDYNVICSENGEFIESGFKHIDDCISWCKKYDLKMVFDIHKAKGYVFDNPEDCLFFEDDGLQQYFINMWMEIARRYGDTQGIIFELLNEVTEARFAQPWNEISTKTIKSLHEIKPNMTIIIGGIFNSSIHGLTLLPKPIDEHVAYTFHCYDPMIFTHQGAYWVPQFSSDYRIKYRINASTMRAESKKIFGDDFDAQFANLPDKTVDSDFFRNDFKEVLEVAKKWNVEVYCGEYGVIDEADRDSAIEWYRDIHEVLDENKIPRAAWSYKEMNFNIGGAENASLLKYL